MAVSPIDVARLLVPQIPVVLRTTVTHLLRTAPTATVWDLRSAIIIHVLRSVIDAPKPSPLSDVQRISLHDPGIKGPMWVAKVVLPVAGGGEGDVGKHDNGQDVRRALHAAFDGLKELGSEKFLTEPDVWDVEAEWTGWRAGVDRSRPPPRGLSSAQIYEKLMKEVSSDVTILYFHGGAYYLMDPASHRQPCARLARLTRGRVLSVRYRLAPQSPFPAALLDALVAYLSLLYPSASAIHAAVPASDIIFSGDSAGAGLSLSLLQLLLELRRQAPANEEPTVLWHGRHVPLPLPAGVAANSAWLDVCRSMPSIVTNAKYDYLPGIKSPQDFPRCAIWPTEPVRHDFYADDSCLLHPLVSPITARDWAGSPPVYMCVGEEMILDEDRYFAAELARQDVPVVFEYYERMPHCFAMVLVSLPGSKKCFAAWADFCVRCVERPASIVARGTVVEAKTLRETELDLRSREGLMPREELLRRMSAMLAKRLDSKDGEGPGKMMPKL